MMHSPGTQYPATHYSSNLATGAVEQAHPDGVRRLVTTHPLLAYIALAWLGSWILWLPRILGVGGVGDALFILGGFAPMAAAALVTAWSGGDLRAWARQLLAWRVPLRYYAYALGLPALVFAVVNVVLAALGRSVDLASLPGRLPTYAGTLVFVAVLGGGLEEPGWRGFALPRLQRTHSPMRATLILGLVWGVWHVPIYGPPGFILPTFLAFYYTWLYNRTGSVLLCVALHASFTPALDSLVLTPDSMLVDVVILLVIVAGALMLAAVTKGRLGLPAADPMPHRI